MVFGQGKTPQKKAWSTDVEHARIVMGFGVSAKLKFCEYFNPAEKNI